MVILGIQVQGSLRLELIAALIWKPHCHHDVPMLPPLWNNSQAWNRPNYRQLLT